MLEIVKKFTLLIALLFTINVAKAEIGVVEVVMRGTNDCYNKVEQVTFKGEMNTPILVALVDSKGKTIAKKQVLINSNAIKFDVPCGFYQLMIVDTKTKAAKSFSVLF